MRSPFSLLTMLAASGISLALPLPSPTTDPSPGAEAEITIKAMDYAFELPAVVRPGPRTVRLLNRGQSLHHVYMVRLEEGKSVADLLAVLKPGSGFPAWAKNIGGPNTPVPGGESVAVVDLAVGHYAVLCFIPANDGMPHVMKGMVKAFEVAGAPLPRTAPPATVSAVLDDYSFTLSNPLTAGRQVIEFSNQANQPHEAFLAKLAPGKKAADLLEWLGKQDGPPPAMPVGGITGIEPGARQSIIVDLTPGNYAWFCFLPDARDGKEHVRHGMVTEFQVGQAKGGRLAARAGIQ